MAEPRATSTDADELAATISGLKSRLNELESSAGAGIPPVGTILDYLGEIAPNGWTLLDGTTITNGRTLYPSLWNVLPNIYKSGNNIVKPDTRGRVLVHKSAAGTLNANIGTVGGDETVTLNATQMPVHNHTIAHTHTMAHTHTYNATSGNQVFVAGGIGPAIGSLNTTSTNSGAASNSTTSAASTSISGDTGGTGGITQAHQNLQPYMVVTKIMRLV